MNDAGKSPNRDIQWSDYRDHLATAHQDGRRKWVYAKRPAGRWYRWRTWLSWALIFIMFAGPFVRINGNPLLLLNIVERKFSILGRIFWPQDSLIFAVAMLIFFAGIMIFTTAFGRLWCGWTCPQTIMMEMVFRKIEYLIEGDHLAQKALAQAPWKPAKIARKLGKHLIFFGLSFLIGNTLFSYIVGTEQLFELVTDDPRRHAVGLTFMTLFSLLFYGIFARFREQACTFICPYGRFMSALVDENTMVVAYDTRRGEARGLLQRHQSSEQRAAAGLGNCIDCHQCVAVCPTGIDIRHGTQMECVNCTACIDACDNIMTRVGSPRGLIRYASLDGIERGRTLRFSARMKTYATVLMLLIGFFLFLVFTRADIATTLLRAPGALFQQTIEGRISNLYTVKVINKTSREIPVHMKLENIDGVVRVMSGHEIVVPKENLAETSLLVEISPRALKEPNTKIQIGVYSRGQRLETINTSFVGPRDGSIGP